MTRLMVRELARALRLTWPLWPLAALLGRAMLPVNADAYRTYIYFDPQGPAEERDAARFDALATYTSGLAWAQLLALLAGAFLVLRGSRQSPALVVLARAAGAAGAGLAIALADLAGALPAADLPTATSTVWTTVVCATLNTALCAAFGAGLAARSGRRRPVLLMTGVLAVASLLFTVKDSLWDPAVILLVALALPAAPWAALWGMTLSSWAPTGTALLLATATLTVLLSIDATQRRSIMGTVR